MTEMLTDPFNLIIGIPVLAGILLVLACRFRPW